MSQTKATILVVDDDATLRELLVDTLETIGYTVVGMSDGIEALEELHRGSYDLLITDIKMPGMDGVALLKKVRRYYPDLPVLFITGVTSPEIIGRASPDGFLAKPFRISHIEELIEETLSGRSETVSQPIRKVLIVDDDDLFRDMLTEALRFNDFIPYAVRNGEEALQELERGTVDAVITDIRMPGMDGITLLKKIKEKYPNLPVVLITAFYSQDGSDYFETTQQADGFLKKPFHVEHIVSLLKELHQPTSLQER